MTAQQIELMGNKKNYTFLLLLSLFWLTTYAQKEDRIWCFPNHCGIDFNNLIQPDTFSSAIGSAALLDQATFADSTGNLFCYAADTNFWPDNLFVWDRNHNRMQNGNLYGHPNNASLFLTYPKHPSKIFLFHVGHPFSTNDLYFSIIDKNLNSGYGDVETKNNLISNTGNLSQYKLAAVRHANGRDWWVLVYSPPVFTFSRYLFTPDGVSFAGSQTFDISNTCGNYGTMVFSRDGTKMMDLGIDGCINVYDFDRCTGLLSNLRDIGEHVINNPDSMQYEYFNGAFSPNGNVIYVSAFNLTKVFYQFDLNAPNIPASKILLNQFPDTGSLQWNTYYNHLLAPDNKIYISRGNGYGINSDTYYTHHLDVIENPDSVGLACNYIVNGFDLGSHHLAGFLPNMAYFGLGALTGSICDSLPSLIPNSSPKEKGVAVFPNPSEGIFDLMLKDGSDKIISLTMEDMLGKEIFSLKNFYSTIDIGNQPAGIYFVHVATQKKNVFVVKVVKQ
jgi:hypothetical protein